MSIGIHKRLSYSTALVVTIFASACFCAQAQAELKVDQAWVKLAPPGAQSNAAYLHLTNTGDSPVVIQSFSADCCKELMLHSTRYENGKVAMEQLEQLSVPANGKVIMKPGGLHIMLLNAKPALVKDDKVELNLHFANGKQQTLMVPVLGTDD